MLQLERQIIVQPNSEPCYDFTTDGVTRLKKTVIIAPIRVEEYDSRKQRITYGCSRGKACRDTECRYAKGLKTYMMEESVVGVEHFR